MAATPFTIILVTHDLHETAFLADAVYVMSKSPGRILALEIKHTTVRHRQA